VSEEAGQEFVFSFLKPLSQRLDLFLVDCLPALSRSRIQNLIKEGMVKVNGKPPHKTGMILEPGAKVQVFLPEVRPSEIIPEAIPLDIVFENADLMVVNKPAGMVVHPAAGHSSGTLVHAALAHAPEIEGIGGEQRPGVVHRLDKDTSGLIMLAKNDRLHRWLQNQFRQQKVQKVYLALVDGHPPTPSGRIEAAIGRDLKARKKMTVVADEKGRRAISEYRVLETFPEHCFLEVRPTTGRTHQIRLHLAFIGCPVVGDKVYGKKRPTLPTDRHFLHAAGLKFRLPDEAEERVFKAPLPLELEEILTGLRTGNY